MQLRQAVLSRELFRDAPAAGSGTIRAVVFDWHVGNGVASLVCFEDGTTSIYLSSGGGVIGAGAHETVQRASAALRDEAQRTRTHFRSADQFPFPSEGQASFYIITTDTTLGTGLLASADLQRSDHSLNRLGALAQEVIAEVRKASPK